MDRWNGMTYLRPKRSRSPLIGKLPPVHSLGFNEDYEDLTSTSFAQSSQSVTSSTDTKLPQIVCSKYSVIGDPHSRKVKFKVKPKLWRMPKFTRENSLLVVEAKDNLFDRKTLYGSKQKKQYERLSHEKSFLLPKLPESVTPKDALSEKEKEYVTRDYQITGPFRRYERDEVHVPTVYHSYFEKQRNKDLYIRHKFREEYRKRNSRLSTCAKTFQEPDPSTHFCDVLGKRFCKHCEEFSNRFFSWKYERRKLFPHQWLYER